MGEKNIGIKSGELIPCPSTPNCVLTSFEYRTLRGEEALEKLITVLESENRCRIITVRKEDPFYIHAEFRSFLFRFVDDVEFLFFPDQREIQVRSASRVGYSDMGVNRKRVEHLKERFYGL
jgi:uncharacterized protein (DUF1499 family)